jgi:hypothetical protein
MIGRLIRHAHRHSIGYVALVFSLFALAGASYAAIQIPNGSVGEKQLKNHAIDPVKWDPTYVTAFIRRWAHVGPNGKLLNSSPFAQAAAVGGTGSYDVTWGDAFNGNCQPLVTIDSGSPSYGTGAGFGNAHVITQQNNATVVNVTTYNLQGQRAAEPFFLAVTCPKGAGGGTTYPYTLP